MRSFFRFFLLLNLLLILILALAGAWQELLNAQVAAVGALLVTMGSFAGYKKMVEQRAAEAPPLSDDERDELDAIDDKYGLFDDEEGEAEDAKTLLKAEKARMAQSRSWGEIIRNFRGAVTLWRFLGYAALVLGFFALRQNGLLSPIFFLGGLLPVPLAALLAGIGKRS